jgi:hypothetical protein
MICWRLAPAMKQHGKHACEAGGYAFAISGVSQRPLTDAVPFASLESMRVTLSTRHHGQVSGMGIAEGVTLVTGGGFHDQLGQITPVLTLPPLGTVLAAANGWEAALEKGDVAAQREVLALLVERVEPERIAHGKYSANVTWTPLCEALRVVVTEIGADPDQVAA